MLRHGFSQLPDQPRKLLDLGGKRRRGILRLVERSFDLALHRAEPAAEFGNLPGDIAGAAGKAGDLVVHFRAVAFAASDGVIDGKRGQDAERDQRCIGGCEAEAQIKHGADRHRDKHHADGNKNGADAHHR